MRCKYLHKTLVISTAVAMLARLGHACVTLSTSEEAQAKLVNESAIIVMDWERGVQHFIRRATFDAKGRSVGFLVPTPTMPILAEAPDEVFTLATMWTLPEKRRETRRRYQLSLFGANRVQNTFQPAGVDLGDLSQERGMTGSVTTSTDADVNVLHQQDVGEYQATVLSARDASALQQWLQRNDYQASPDLVEWLQPYVKNGWKITAFKIARPLQTALNQPFASGAVRMSFRTQAPFFPYREPASQREDTTGTTQATRRSLRVFLLDYDRMKGNIGSGQKAQEWPARTTWANYVATDRVQNLWKQLNLQDEANAPKNDWPAPSPDNRWMTVFDDETSPRPGFEDIVFERSDNRSSLVPSPRITYYDEYVYIPAELILVLGGATIYGFGLFARRRKHRSH